jgi:hypothetical protein
LQKQQNVRCANNIVSFIQHVILHFRAPKFSP